MSVTASDIIAYGAANMPEDDTSLTGGAIDRTKKVTFTAMSATGTLDIVSSTVDTQTVTITGRQNNGEILVEAYTLDGTTPQVGTGVFERVLKAVAGGTHAGIITVSENGVGNLFTMEGTTDAPGGAAVLETRRMFYGAAALPAGSGAKPLYEKMFIANTNAVTALTTAAVVLSSDNTPSGGIVDFDLEDGVNDINFVAVRTHTPTGVLGSWSNDSKSVPGGGTLGDRPTGTSDHIGVWVKLGLNDGQAAAKSDFTLTTSGNTT